MLARIITSVLHQINQDLARKPGVKSKKFERWEVGKVGPFSPNNCMRPLFDKWVCDRGVAPVICWVQLTMTGSNGEGWSGHQSWCFIVGSQRLLCKLYTEHHRATLLPEIFNRMYRF